MTSMGTLKAVVQNGRLVLDEPTELPEGTVVELEERRAEAGGRPVRLEDEMPPEELAHFRSAVRESMQQLARGEVYSAEEALDEL